jgi:hypothetical protein
LSAIGGILYFVEIVGPDQVSANLNVTANGSLFSESGGGGFGSFSHDRLFVNGDPIVDRTSSLGNNTGAFAAFAVEPVFTNIVYVTQIIADVLADLRVPVSANAFIDPMFSIDQSLIDAGYSIQVSAGFGNGLTTPSAVPEPASIALLLGPLLLLLGWGTALTLQHPVGRGCKTTATVAT